MNNTSIESKLLGIIDMLRGIERRIVNIESVLGSVLAKSSPVEKHTTLVENEEILFKPLLSVKTNSVPIGQ